MFRWLLALLVLVVARVAGGVYVVAGRGDAAAARPSTNRIASSARPARSRSRPARRARSFTALTIALEQNGKTFPLFALDARRRRPTVDAASTRDRIAHHAADRQAERARAAVRRRADRRHRDAAVVPRTCGRCTSTASKDFQVRLEPPRIAVLSTHHYVNHGGSEMVVYRATPPDVASGVRVGDVEYPGFPAAGAGVAGADPALKVAFFALLHDQDLKTPIVAFARDEAGNEAKASLRRPRVPEAVQEEPHRARRQLPQPRRAGDPRALAGAEDDGAAERRPMLPAFLKINGELRRIERRRRSRRSPKKTVADAAVERAVRPAGQLAGRGELRRPPHLHLQGQGSRPAGAPRLRPGGRPQQCRSSPPTPARC